MKTKENILFIHYPKCTTCKRAKKWLEKNGVSFNERDITKDNPEADELKKWIKDSNYDIKKFFNTSGNMYKEMKLKDKLAEMNDEEKISLLSTNGMLVKRPIIIGKEIVLVGFKENEWRDSLL